MVDPPRRSTGGLVIRVEIVKLLRRPRTWAAIVMLNALPTLVAVLLALTDIGPRPGTGPPFLWAVLADTTLFPLAALAIVLPLFLPVAVAVVGGEAVAGEAQTGALRYLLVRPVGRTNLLLAKLVSVVVFVLLAVLVVVASGMQWASSCSVRAPRPAECPRCPAHRCRTPRSPSAPRCHWPTWSCRCSGWRRWRCCCRRRPTRPSAPRWARSAS